MFKVIMARLQAGIHAGAVGDLGDVLPPSKTLQNLEMTSDGNNLFVSFSYKNIKKRLLIPHTNIKFLELEHTPPAPFHASTPVIVKTKA